MVRHTEGQVDRPVGEETGGLERLGRNVGAGRGKVVDFEQGAARESRRGEDGEQVTQVDAVRGIETGRVAENTAPEAHEYSPKEHYASTFSRRCPATAR